MDENEILHKLLALVFIQLASTVGVTRGLTWNVTCPEICKCRLRSFLRTVDCSNRKLKIIPPDVPPETQVLLLKGNVIRSADDALARLTSLRQVDLSHNLIGDPGGYVMFENLTVLEKLKLDGNDITRLVRGGFSSLSNLRQLSLSGNRIRQVNEHAFDGLNRLQQLMLDRNVIPTIEAVWFEGTPNLEILNVDFNTITDVSNGTFRFLRRLSKLSLAGNEISSLNSLAFAGLEKLQELSLNHNRLQTIPNKALAVFNNLQTLSLNQNDFVTIKKREIRGLRVTAINLTNIANLRNINEGAFYDLPDLTLLYLHDNPKLTYLDPRAFVKVPKLKKLFLHNNHLMALPKSLRDLPRLEHISYYQNPIHCDCNIHWIKEIITNGTPPSHQPITFQDADKFICDTPIRLNGQLLSHIPLSQIPAVCPPTVIPFFNGSYQRELGSFISYQCRAIGVPTPHVHWILSNGKVVNNTSNFSRVRLEYTGTLSVDHLKATDAGTYTCVATNPKGYSMNSTVLRIHSKAIRLLHQGVATNFITVTWTGSGSTVSTTDYVIMYRKSNSLDPYGQIHLRPYMRTYTISNLQPETSYEFCIAYQHTTELVKLNCLDIKTKHQMYAMVGISKMGSTTVVVAFAITIICIIFLCVTTACVRQFCRRKAYKEPEGVNCKVGTMSNIPLDNIYHPPSTPLCTSRTSLITNT